VNTARPVITGAPRPDATVRCDPGTWTGALSFSYAWLLDGAQVATGDSYAVAPADLGRSLTCVVTAAGLAGISVADSVAVTVVEQIRPVATEGVVAAGGPNRVAVSWRAFVDSAATAVEVQTAASSTGPFARVGIAPADDLGFTIRGLTDGTTVFLRVRAVLPDAEKGPWSEVLPATPGPITQCGSLTHDETWPAEVIEPTCAVSLNGHALILEAGATVRSQGLYASAGSRLIAPAHAGVATTISSACLPSALECSTTASLEAEVDAELRLRSTRLEHQSIALRGAVGEVSGGSVNQSTVYAITPTVTTPVAWVGNAFTATTYRADGGLPVLQRNTFAGVDDPVTLQGSLDLASVGGNTASGPPRHGVFAYNGAKVRGTWTPEAAGSGVQHRLDQVAVEDGGHAMLRAGLLAKNDVLIVRDGGKLSATGTAADPVVVTSRCDTTIGGDGGCSGTTRGAMTWQSGAIIDLDDADIRQHTIDIDRQGGTGATGSVHDSAITDTTIIERPASIEWTLNTFTRTAHRAETGAKIVFTDNTSDDSTFVLDGVARPELDGNAWTGAANPLNVNDATDLSGVAATNEATGATEEQRRLRFARGAVPAGTSMSGVAGDKGIYVFDDVDVHGTYTSPSTAVVDLASDLEIKPGGALTATGSDFRSLGSADERALEAEPGSTLTVSGGSLEGKIVGSCDAPYAGGAIITITGVSFSGAAELRNCNTDATGGPKASALDNVGIAYRSSHENTCSWSLPEPPSGPDEYTRRVWDVTGVADDPPCQPGYVETVNTSPTH